MPGRADLASAGIVRDISIAAKHNEQGIGNVDAYRVLLSLAVVPLLIKYRFEREQTDHYERAFANTALQPVQKKRETGLITRQ